MMHSRQIDDLNCVIRFLARQDLTELTSAELFARRGIRQVDRLILLGGITSPDFAEITAEAFHNGFAAGLMVVGGIGHSTQNLRDNIARHPRYGKVPTVGRPEADMLFDILTTFLGVPPERILVERQSTNCGNNATFALEVARKENAVPRTAVILQDPTMERRTCEAFLRGWETEPTTFDCVAPVIPLLTVQNGAIAFENPVHAGYYKMDGFLKLVMGEIPRLRDDENGYGPKGHNFINHVDIPASVLDSFNRLTENFSGHIRPRYTPYST
ncbi:MAG: YdcF family protein [Kiritimatiellaceae bacterium]|nr:YdcF family protein [Kiritimatiellaceae bacterium]